MYGINPVSSGMSHVSRLGVETVLLSVHYLLFPSTTPLHNCDLLLAHCQVTHVGEMVDRHILSETLEKQKRAFRRRTLPPTLRQVLPH